MSILRSVILNISAGIRQVLPAQPCVLCGSMSRDGLWCTACDRALPYLEAAHCPSCALPTPTGEVCGQCLKRPPLLARTTAVFGYAFPLDKLIQAMKYRELLAAGVARGLGLELLPHACRRVRDTPPQSALPWKERKKNMRDAFCCDADLTGRRVALVDDVLTTGASLNALAGAVQKRGAVEISAWVVARTLPRSGLRIE